MYMYMYIVPICIIIKIYLSQEIKIIYSQFFFPSVHIKLLRDFFYRTKQFSCTFYQNLKKYFFTSNNYISYLSTYFICAIQ